MSRASILNVALSLALASLGSAACAADGASGSFRIADQDYTVADAIAWRYGDELRLSFSDKAYDRAAFAEDGTLDSFDFLNHEGVTVEVGVSGSASDGSASGVSTRISGGSQDGDRAWVDFTGSESGSPVTGTGVLRRSEGRWRVESVNTSQAAA